MTIIYLVLVILLAEKLLYLTPFLQYTDELGLVLMGLGLLYYLRRSRELNRLLNVFSLCVFFHLTLVLIQAPIASFKYDQPVLDGVIGAKHQFYYLSFPLFVLALNSSERTKRLMMVLSAISLVIVCLGIIHNLGIARVFSGTEEDEWWNFGQRSGVARFWFPGLNILILTGIWQFLRYLNDSRKISSLGTFAAIFTGVLLRQTRARIITLTAVLGLIAYRQRRYGLIASIGLVMLAVVLVQSIGAEKNIFINAFETAYHDLSQGEGTWAARQQQIDIAKQVFWDGFWLGSGAVALRGVPHTTDWDELSLETIAYSADLGYWTWLKYYGFPGLVLLLLMVWGYVWYALKRPRKPAWEDLVQLAVYHFVAIWVSSVTLGYLTSAPGIVMLCLSWALLVNGTCPASHRAGGDNVRRSCNRT